MVFTLRKKTQTPSQTTAQARPLTAGVLQDVLSHLAAEGRGDRWLSRRCEPRYTLSGEVHVESTDHDRRTRQLTGSCWDVSNTGLGIRVRQAMAEYVPIAIRLQLAGKIWLIRGRVARCTQAVGGYRVGIKFHLLPSQPY